MFCFWSTVGLFSVTRKIVLSPMNTTIFRVQENLLKDKVDEARFEQALYFNNGQKDNTKRTLKILYKIYKTEPTYFYSTLWSSVLWERKAQHHWFDITILTLTTQHFRPISFTEISLWSAISF